MTKNDDQHHEKVGSNVADDTLRATKSVSKSVKSLKSIRSPSDKKQSHPRTRRVKFAEPIIHLRLYDRTASPNAETEAVKNPRINPTALDQLSPPLSLVAHLDMAAKKLNARGGGGGQHHQAQHIERDATPPPPPSYQPQTQPQQHTTTATTTTTGLAAPASKTQHPNKDLHLDSVKSIDTTTSSKSTIRAHIKSDAKNDPKKDSKKTRN